MPLDSQTLNIICSLVMPQYNYIHCLTDYNYVDSVQLTTANHVLLSIGVIISCVAIVICICLIVGQTAKVNCIYRIYQLIISTPGSRLSLVLLVVGGVLVVVSVVVWVAVAFQFDYN